MNEEKKMKKNLLKNMLINLIVFAILFLIFDFIIYNQISNSLYKDIDKELMQEQERYSIRLEKQIDRPIKEDENKRMEKENPNMQNFKDINPRIIFIIRDEEGNITNADQIGQTYQNYIDNIEFEKNNLM